MKTKLMKVLLIMSLLMQPMSALAGGRKPLLPPADRSHEPRNELPVSCDVVLSKCDKALRDQITLNHSKQGLIDAQDQHIVTQRERIDQLTSENKSIFRSPWLWMGLGIITGVVISR